MVDKMAPESVFFDQYKPSVEPPSLLPGTFSDSEQLASLLRVRPQGLTMSEIRSSCQTQSTLASVDECYSLLQSLRTKLDVTSTANGFISSTIRLRPEPSP